MPCLSYCFLNALCKIRHVYQTVLKDCCPYLCPQAETLKLSPLLEHTNTWGHFRLLQLYEKVTEFSGNIPGMWNMLGCQRHPPSTINYAAQMILVNSTKIIIYFVYTKYIHHINLHIQIHHMCVVCMYIQLYIYMHVCIQIYLYYLILYHFSLLALWIKTLCNSMVFYKIIFLIRLSIDPC